MHDHLTLIELCRVLISEPAGAELRMAEVRRLEERVGAAEEDSKPLCVAPARVDNLMAEHASLTAGAEQANAERDSLATRMHKLEVAAAT